MPFNIGAHELGHKWGLSEQYCSNQAGSTDDRCNDGDLENDGAASGDVNWLDADSPYYCLPDGSDHNCCNYNDNHNCADLAYGEGVCCLGNLNSQGGRSTMSFADVDLFAPGPIAFDDHELAYLSNFDELQCLPVANATLNSSTQFLDPYTTLFDISLLFHDDGTVDGDDIRISEGLPPDDALQSRLSGPFMLKILDDQGVQLEDQSFNIYFDYSGPVFSDVDYSDISYEVVGFSLYIPYSRAMERLEIYHDDSLVFSRDLPKLYDIFLPMANKNR